MNDTIYNALIEEAKAIVAEKNMQQAPTTFCDIHITQKQVARFCIGKTIKAKTTRLQQKIKRRLGI